MKSESSPPHDQPVETSDSPLPSASRPHGLPFTIPDILLEGDDAETDAPAEDPKKFSVTEAAGETEGELPEAYGTKKLLLAARDPHWLYAHWDLTRGQQRDYCERSATGHLVLRVHGEDQITPVSEISLPPEARHWFVHVLRSGIHYNAELGCLTPEGQWISISISPPALAPSPQMKAAASAAFATLPFETPLPDLVQLARAAAPELSLTEALEKLRREGHPGLPAGPKLAAWSAEQERALAEMGRVQTLPDHAPSSPGLGPDDWLTSPGGISSLFGYQAPRNNFWLSVNAELVIHGATEPGASVTLGGWPVQLRPDGSFTFRFALPDGEFELPLAAVAEDSAHGRAAVLKFLRTTELHGEVGRHPLDPSLVPPMLETSPVAS